MPAVRPARPADRPALRRLGTHLPEPAPELLAHALRTGGVLVSPARGRPVGYLLAVGTTFGSTGDGDGGPPEAGGRRRPPEAAVPPEPSDGRTTGDGRGSDGRADGMHVAELVVAPARRREGRASALLDRAVAATTGPATVAVAPGNGAARALYRARGFEAVERRADYFASGPALWLVRR